MARMNENESGQMFCVRRQRRATLGMWPFGSARRDEFAGDELEDVPPPFWETDVVVLGERERREANYYEGLRPLWPKLGQLMVRNARERVI